jgi:SAM-dependent methyltransferase
VTSYTFGHSSSAADRLRILARVYEPESATFLRDYAPDHPLIALDLGCGPGHTTALVATTTGARKVHGLDMSPGFITAARSEYGGLAEFHVQDVTRAPFPGGPAALIFCRLLLTHLPEPQEALATWVAALAPGGGLLIDEVDAISAPDPTCQRYLEIAAGVVTSGGGELYIGPRLAGWKPPQGAAVLLNQAIPCDVTAADAASMFRLNLPNWAGRAIAEGLTSAQELNAITADLDRLADGMRHAPPIRWHMRHLVVEWRP